ncbi:MAG: hypothetical protein ACI92A_002284 [Candidatus Paceibacteria bacterium]
MISQLIGAFVRAILVALLIAMPSIILPGVGSDAREISMVFALVGAALTMFEYGSSHPGLVEFRFAPPFNRIRFITLFVTVLLLAMMFRGEVGGNEMTRVVLEIGTLVGTAMDFPFSPVRILTVLLTNDGSAANTDVIRSAAGISYVVSLVSLAVFAIFMRLLAWPLGNRSFNVWVNLPMFDPASGPDVEERLTRDARVNVIFGFTLPFLIPLVAQVASAYFDFSGVENTQTIIWMVAAWAFLPASLFMRGIAMGKIARLIRRKREQLSGPRRVNRKSW